MTTTGIGERVIALGPGLAPIPERLLLAHSRGQVLFIAGAGICRPPGLPDFRNLVIQVYQPLDRPVHEVISGIPLNACNQWNVNLSGLTDRQSAEVRRFIRGDYDVVLGMLERRMDGQSGASSTIRRSVASQLRPSGLKPARIHTALMRLADRGGVQTIVT